MAEERTIDELSAVLADIQAASMPDLTAAIDRLETSLRAHPMAIRPQLELMAAEVWSAFVTTAAQKLIEREAVTESETLTCPNCDEETLAPRNASFYSCGCCGYRERR